MALTGYDVVVPSLGRPSLDALLGSLATQEHPPDSVVVVDDRPGRPADGLEHRVPASLALRTAVLRTGGRGPAAARNVGWRRTSAPWVVFLDDDVVLDGTWSVGLLDDLQADGAGAVQGDVVVPLAADRPPTDRELNVARLSSAPWITADLAVRRPVLDGTGGFDERFPRAYREDTDFHLRARAAGHRFARGRRRTWHPVGAAQWWASVAAQRGNADDALLRARHGPEALDRGRRNRHELVTAALAVAVAAAALRRPMPAAIAGAAWLAGTTELAVARIRPAARTPGHVAAMVATSVAIPPTATYHWWRGRWRWRHVDPFRAPRRGEPGHDPPSGAPLR